jgi:hypothetical protein
MHADGTPFTKGDLSAKYARAWLMILKQVTGNLIVQEYVAPMPNPLVNKVVVVDITSLSTTTDPTTVVVVTTNHQLKPISVMTTYPFKQTL